jgi:hypothetical protein
MDESAWQQINLVVWILPANASKDLLKRCVAGPQINLGLSIRSKVPQLLKSDDHPVGKAISQVLERRFYRG